MAIAEYLQLSSEYYNLHCYTFRTILGKEENNLNNVNILCMSEKHIIHKEELSSFFMSEFGQYSKA